jgi:hypothetical protein
MELQELLSRARLTFDGSPKRLQVFMLVNGRRSGKDIARKCRRSLSNVLRDLARFEAMELIRPKEDAENRPVKKEDSAVFEKSPLVAYLPASYFTDYVLGQSKTHHNPPPSKTSRMAPSTNPIPNEKEILEICRAGEDQTYEFKSQGTEVQKLTKEIAAFANTKAGGVILYGVTDDGTIQGTDISRQKLDQPLQNSVRNSILPSLIIALQSRRVAGYEILLIATPPWNRKNVYQLDGRVYIRKGTNVFIAKPEEVRDLHEGRYII